MMVSHKPSIRLGQRKYHSSTMVPGFMTLGQCPRVVYLKGQAPSKVQKMHICKPSPVQAIIDEIIAQMERNWAGASNPMYTLDVTWVQGHSGVKGNKTVDHEAKEAAKKCSSQKRNLLKFLNKAPLPKSISVQWQEFIAVYK